METTTETEIKTQSSTLASKVLTGFAYVASIAVGGFVADNRIKEACYHKLKNSNAEIKQLVKDREEIDRPKVWAKAPTMPDGWAAKEFKSLDDKFETKVKKVFIKNDMKTNTHFWTALNRAQKINVAEKVFTVSGIVLAGLLTLANSKWVTKTFSSTEVTKEKKTQER
jgi:hypothetical protein